MDAFQKKLADLEALLTSLSKFGVTEYADDLFSLKIEKEKPFVADRKLKTKPDEADKFYDVNKWGRK